MSAAQAEALRLFRETGNRTEVARIMGKSRATVRGLIDRGLAAENAPEGQRAAIAATGLHGVAKAGWRITKHPDGSRDSVYWRAEEPEAEQPEDVIDRIADRLNRIQPAPAIKRPNVTRTDIRNFVPLFDVHLSMRIGSYGTAQAVDRLRTGVADLLERSPPAECTVILNGGDFTHQNGPDNLTPQSKHPLPVDAEYDDTTDVATDVTADMIETALKRSDHVIYKALKGNHDPHTARILRAALRQRYRNEPRVTIEDTGIDFFAHEWDGNLICGHHGDLRGKKPADFVLGFAAKYAEAWGRTRYRDLWTGHLHHLKVCELPGMTTNQVRAIAPADRHSTEELYVSHSEMIAVTYRKGGGRYGYLNHCF